MGGWPDFLRHSCCSLMSEILQKDDRLASTRHKRSKSVKTPRSANSSSREKRSSFHMPPAQRVESQRQRIVILREASVAYAFTGERVVTLRGAIAASGRDVILRGASAASGIAGSPSWCLGAKILRLRFAPRRMTRCGIQATTWVMRGMASGFSDSGLRLPRRMTRNGRHPACSKWNRRIHVAAPCVVGLNSTCLHQHDRCVGRAVAWVPQSACRP